VIDELAKFPKGSHRFRNNDADLYRITAKASRLPRVAVYGELFQKTFSTTNALLSITSTF